MFWMERKRHERIWSANCAATAVLAAAGFLAGFLPAWRSARVDPMEALRYEYAIRVLVATA